MWSQWSSPGWCRFRLGHVGYGLHTGTADVIPPAFALKPHKTQFFPECFWRTWSLMEFLESFLRKIACEPRLVGTDRAWGHVQVGQGHVSRSHQGGASRGHLANVDSDQAVCREGSTQGRSRSSLQASPYTTELSFSLYVSGTPQAAVPSRSPR